MIHSTVGWAVIVDALVQGHAFSPVGIPLVAAGLAILFHRVPTVQRVVLEAGVLLMLISSALLVGRVARDGVIITAFGGWPAPFGVTFVADRLSAALATVTGLVALAVVIYARAEIGARRRRAGFDALFLAMLAAVNGAFLTGDIFNLYVWFELMLVTALGLMTLDRRRAQMDGAIRYASMSMLGATFILLGVGMLFGEAGSLNMIDLAERLAGSAPTVTLTAAGFLLLAGFVLKTGLFPLFFWLPASYHTAPNTALAALAGLLTKVGFYACLRVFVLVFDIAGAPVVPGLPAVLGVLAAATMIASVLAAIAQVDIRRLLGYHIVGQVAYPVVGLAMASFAGVTAAIFYMMHTMLVQTGLFLGAGAVARANGSYDIRLCGGLMGHQPMFAGLFAILAFSMVGVPPFSGFWGKVFVIDAAFRGGAVWLALVALLVGFLTLYSMSILWSKAFWKAPPRSRSVPRRIPPAMTLALVILCACTLGIGLAVEPISAYVREAARQLTFHAGTGGTP